MAGTAHDLVIRGGQVADGRGGEPVAADVAVDGPTIVAVGPVTGRAARRSTPTGLLVTPGFVDIHTHYDGQVTWDPRWPRHLAWRHDGGHGQLRRGLRAGAARTTHDRLICLMEGVEDIPGAVLDEGSTWNWESFPRLPRQHRAAPHDIDVARLAAARAAARST